MICATADLGNTAKRFNEREAGQQALMCVLVLPRMWPNSATLKNSTYIHDILLDLAAKVIKKRLETRCLSLKEILICCMKFGVLFGFNIFVQITNPDFSDL